ncbi:MAG: lipid A deacylase LpxR family protein [Gammaproteobacteria bacterium]|nr:lipid A deacylase LpxR family protein [Gammaproteobacteria bacterium]
MKNNKYIIAVLFYICSANALSGQEKDSFYWSSISSYHVDQDLLAGEYNEDRNYTMGVTLVWAGDISRDHILSTHSFLNALDRYLGITTTPSSASVSLGVTAFTPDNLQDSSPIFTDRPYSSLLFSSSSQVYKRSDTFATESSLTLGVLGLPIAEVVQTAIHVVSRFLRNRDRPYNPEGWDHQISNGGEPTFKYTWTAYQYLPVAKYFDAALSFDGSFGYYTNVSAGAGMRLGKFNDRDKFWNIIKLQDPQSDANKMLSNRSLAKMIAPEEIYFSAGYRQRYVEYNALLQCQVGDSDVCLDASDIENNIEEISLAITYTPVDSGTWSVNCNKRSSEHKLADARDHRWCGINYYRLF